MSGYDWSSFWANMRSAIGAVWPEVVPNGIAKTVRLEMLDFDRLTAPRCVLQPGAARRTDWAMTTQDYELTLRVYYVARISTQEDRAELVEERLEALRDYLIGTGLSKGQVLEVEEIDASETSPINHLLIGQKKPFVGGGLTVRIRVGVLARDE